MLCIGAMPQALLAGARAQRLGQYGVAGGWAPPVQAPAGVGAAALARGRAARSPSPTVPCAASRALLRQAGVEALRGQRVELAAAAAGTVAPLSAESTVQSPPRPLARGAKRGTSGSASVAAASSSVGAARTQASSARAGFGRGLGVGRDDSPALAAYTRISTPSPPCGQDYRWDGGWQGVGLEGLTVYLLIQRHIG